MSAYSYEKKLDVVIVGAGVIGCSIAYYLAKDSSGKLKVGVIERNTIGEESSSGAAGMLAAQVECDLDSPFLRLALASRALFEELVPELGKFSQVDVGYLQSGILSTTFGSEEEEKLKARLVWQKKMGLDCEWFGEDQLKKRFPFLSPELCGGLWAAQDGQVSSHRLTLAFAEAARKLGVEFFENESFDRVPSGKPRVTCLETNLSKFSANLFIFAAGSWTGKLLEGFVPVEPVKGQILIFELPAEWRRKYVWKEPLYVGQTPGPDPIVCYFVPKGDGHLLVGASSERCGFDKSINKEITRKISEYCCKVFPELESFPFKGAWVGLRPSTPDHLPVMGLVPGFDNVYVASGHFRNGILLSPVTGKLFSELILTGRTSISLEPFSPARFGVRS